MAAAPRLAVAVGALLLTASLAAFGADESPGGTGTSDRSADGQKAAEETYREGVRAYSAGRYADAIELFRHADRLSPSAALSFNVARAYEKIGDVPAALAWYRDYLRRAPGTADEAEVRRGVDRLEAELARRGVQQVTIRSEPLGATITLDGEPVGVTPWTGEIRPGSHGVSLGLRGYQDVARQVELSATDSLDVTARLVPEVRARPSEAPPAKSQRADAAAEGRRGHGARTWGFVALGAGAAALGGAAAFEVLRRSALEDAKDEDEQLAASRHLRAARDRQLTARILAGTGAVLAAGGGVLLFLDSRREAGPRRQVAVSCNAVGCGLTALGAFE